MRASDQVGRRRANGPPRGTERSRSRRAGHVTRALLVERFFGASSTQEETEHDQQTEHQPLPWERVMATGVRQRHGRACDGSGRCKCPYEAFVYSKRDGKKIRKTFATHSAARAWRQDAD